MLEIKDKTKLARLKRKWMANIKNFKKVNLNIYTTVLNII